MITVNKGMILPKTTSRLRIINNPAKKNMPVNPNQPVTTNIKGRSFQVSLEGWTQNDIDRFNDFNNKLGGIYTQWVLHGKLNPYLTEEQKLISQKEADNEFMSTFMNVMLHHMFPNDAFNLGQMIMRDINLGFKSGAEKYLATGACKLYVSNAAALEKIQKSLIREETAIEELGIKLKDFKQKYQSETDPAQKIKLAKEHNALVDIHNTHVQVYNQLLTEEYTPIAKAQQKLAKDITNKLLQGNKDAFRDLLGKVPKLPKGVD